MTEGGHDRRGFFKALLREAAQTAAEVASAVRPELDFEPPRADALGYGTLATVPGGPSSRRVSLDELRAFCGQVGLFDRADEAVRHARLGLRLTHSGEGPQSRLGGLPHVPDGFEWPVWRGEQLALLAQISLAEAAAVEPDLPLPGEGLLLVFYALSAAPAGMRPLDEGSCRVVFVEDAAAAAPSYDGPLAVPPVPLLATPELTLPSEATGLPPSLELDVFELDLWQRLRERLAAAHGVELETQAPEFHALHRLLGHHDALHDGLEVDCQLASHGIDLSTGDRFVDPRAPELEATAHEWRLLVQISSDDELGLSLGTPPGRLTVWIREDDLRERRFDRIWARLV